MARQTAKLVALMVFGSDDPCLLVLRRVSSSEYEVPSLSPFFERCDTPTTASLAALLGFDSDDLGYWPQRISVHYDRVCGQKKRVHSESFIPRE